MTSEFEKNQSLYAFVTCRKDIKYLERNICQRSICEILESYIQLHDLHIIYNYKRAITFQIHMINMTVYFLCSRVPRSKSHYKYQPKRGPSLEES